MTPIQSSLIGVIGDVHAEDARLAEALEYLLARGAGVLLCTGDVPDGVGSVSRCSELLLEHGVVTVRGNHERWFLTETMRSLPDATPTGSVTLAAREHLAKLPPTCELATPLGGLLLCHGLGSNDMAKVGPDDAGYAIDTNDELQALIRDPRYRFVVNGHSHRAMVRHFPGLTVINAGTLRGDHEPGFLLLDLDGRQVEMFRWNANGIARYRAESLDPTRG